MTRASDNEFPSVLFDEQPSDVSTPAAGFWRAFFKSDGMYVIDDAGTVTGPFGVGGGGGSVATDTIWDAAGDLVVGTGADAAARLAIGATDGMAVRRVAGAVAWAFPPGHVLDRTTFTGNVSITATTEATANTVVTAGAIAFDGSTVVDIQFFCPGVSFQATNGVDVIAWLYDGSSSIGKIEQGRNSASQSHIQVFNATVQITPSAATHTYSVRMTTSSGTSVANAGAGGAGVFYPGFIKISIA